MSAIGWASVPAGVESRHSGGCLAQRSHVQSAVKSTSRLTSHGKASHIRTHAASSKVNPMLHPPGPSKLYPEANKALEDLLADVEDEEERRMMEAIEAVIETPPEWGRPDEGNPNQPRRPPEYQPPQEPVPGIGDPPPEFNPPQRSPPSPPVPQDDPMRPLPPEQPEIPPNERDPLKKAPEQMPGERPTRRGDEQTQPQPGEAQALSSTSAEEMIQQAELDVEAAEQATLYYIDWCRQSFGIRGLVDFWLGTNAVPMVHLTHPNGSTASIHLQGANVTSWTNPDGAELLHLREQNPDEPIQGGIPICFPNWGPKHGLPTDGFLKDLHWSVAEAGHSPIWAEDPAPQVTLIAESNDATLAVWPHQFEASYTVQLMIPDDFPDLTPTNRYHQPRHKETFGALSDANLEPEPEEREEAPITQLRCQLNIINTDDKPFSFTTGLQSHVACRDLHTHHNFARVLGLGAKTYIDYSPNVRKPKLAVESDDYVHFGNGEVDRMYIDAYASTVKFCPGDRTHFELLLREGLTDLGVLNKGLLFEHQSEFADFVVLTPAQSGRPVELEPGESWTGEVALRWHDKYWEIPLFDKGPQPGGFISDAVMPGYEQLERQRGMPVLPPRQGQKNRRMPAFDQ